MSQPFVDRDFAAGPDGPLVTAASEGASTALWWTRTDKKKAPQCLRSLVSHSL